MFKLNVILISLLVSLFSCASPEVYKSAQEDTAVKLTLNREMEPFLLTSLTTIIHKYPEYKMCGEKLDPQTVKLLMRYNQRNPLITNINYEGVYVEADEPLVLAILSFSGMNIPCTHIVKFIPNNSKNYELRLTGQITNQPFDCNTELWSIDKISNVKNKEKFDEFQNCAQATK